MKFHELAVGQDFDWINPAAPHFNSFFLRCTKTGDRSYEDSNLASHKVGSIYADVFHVGNDEQERIAVAERDAKTVGYY
jgi:hypothetical protein